MTGWLVGVGVLVLLVVGLIVWLVRTARSDERNEVRAEEAEGDAETRRKVADIHASRRTREQRRADAQRVLDARRNHPK